MNEDIKVSVIVPAYNVEKYIKKCINSILEQTYKNIEVIVVNDGSTDATEKLLFELQSFDSRLIVLSIENVGVSDARNIGLEKSSGDYVVFVDGDDYLAPDFVDYMLKLVRQTGTQFCISKNCYTQVKDCQIEEDSVAVMDATDATALLLSPRVIVGCWNKIFLKKFLDENNIRFSTELFYGEGLSFIITAAQCANGVGVGNRKVYYYRRNNEASATTKFDVEKYINGEKALKTIHDNLRVSNDKVEAMFNLHMGLFCMGATVRIKANRKEKEYLEEYRHWKNETSRYTRMVISKKEVSLYRKLMLLGGCFNPWVMMRLDGLRRKRIAANSVKN